MPLELLRALADRDPAFIHDGSEAWSRDYAVRFLEAAGGAAAVEPALDALQSAAQPAPRSWLGDRLTVLWTMFMASRTQIDPDALTIWLAEHMRLLGDLPHDIVAAALDRAVQSARHGFIPSIGEVRAIAEPMVSERSLLIDRLKLLSEATA